MKSSGKIIVIVVILLAIAVGYASFSGVLRVSGTADASGKFDVVFTNGVISTSNHGTAVVNQADNTKMAVNVKLGYPGDGCFVTATVANNGTVPAELVGFNVFNKGTTTAFYNNDIEVLIPDMNTIGSKVLQAGESTTITFTVKWKQDSTATSAVAEFDIELDYEQATANKA